jgi:signal transduction histidine kinase
VPVVVRIPHRRLFDAALAAVVLAMFEMPAFDPYRHDSRHWWPAWGFVIAAPLLWRRSRPVAVLAVSLAGSAGAVVTRSGPNWGALSQATIFIGPAVALASAGAALPRSLSKALAEATGAVIVAVTVLTQSAPDTLVAELVVVGGAWAAGEAVRARRHEIVLLQEVVAGRAEQAADAERNRIARELHDVVAHQLSVIAIQAGAARLAAGPTSPLAGGLAAIEEASRVALADVRSALGVLRDDGEPCGVGPQPGLEMLDHLAGRLRQAGLPVAVTTAGDLGGLPSGLGVSAYRIVQEALTNVLTHAGTVATHVRVERTSSELELDVRNGPPATGYPVASSNGGRGLLGMRERVAAFRGTIHAGPLPTGGFAVTAHIPLA